jgi:hypothetical protein
MTGGKSGISMILTPGKSGYRTVIWVNTVNTPEKVTTWLPAVTNHSKRRLPSRNQRDYRALTAWLLWLIDGYCSVTARLFVNLKTFI